jgi:hypothetical protein
MTTNTTNTTNTDSIFFTLPPEIREIVYSYALAASRPIHRVNPIGEEHKPPSDRVEDETNVAGLFQVCKQIYLEAETTLYKSNTCSFSQHDLCLNNPRGGILPLKRRYRNLITSAHMTNMWNLFPDCRNVWVIACWVCNPTGLKTDVLVSRMCINLPQLRKLSLKLDIHLEEFEKTENWVADGMVLKSLGRATEDGYRHKLMIEGEDDQEIWLSFLDS